MCLISAATNVAVIATRLRVGMVVLLLATGGALSIGHAAGTNKPAVPRRPPGPVPANRQTNQFKPIGEAGLPEAIAATRRFLNVPHSPANASNSLPTLTRVSDVLDLGVDGARLRPHPVRVLGVAMTHAIRGTSFFIHDGSGSIQAVATFTDQLPADLIGRVLWVDGVAGNGPLKPWIAEARLQILGMAPLPPPRSVPFSEILSGRLHGERVVAEGTIRDILRGSVFALLLANSGGHLEVEVLHRGPRLGPLPMDWYQTRMAVTGVVLTDVDTRGRPSVTRLLVRDAQDLQILHRYPTNIFDLPITTSAQHPPDPAPRDELVKLEGTVLHHSSDQRLFLRDSTGAFQATPLDYLPQRGTRVTTIDRPPAQRFQPGDQVEVVGVRAPSGFAPVFMDAEYRKSGRKSPPPPVELSVEEAIAGSHDADLVTLRARLVGRETRTVDHILHDVLRLQSGKIVFEALVEKSQANALPEIPPDTRVRLTGLSSVSQLTEGGLRSLRLWLRSPSDLTVLGPAAPWEVVPPLRILSVSGALGTVAAGWIVFLRRQVRQRRRAEDLARQSEASARTLNEELEHRIQLRTSELVAANTRLRESEARFSRAFRSTPALLSIARLPDQRIIEVNEAFLNASGFSQDEVVGRTHGQLAFWVDPAEQAEFFCQILDRGFVHSFESRFRTKDGREEIVLLSAEAVDLAGQTCALCLGVVVTQRKRAERELVRALAHERELSELRSRFVAMVSHEFRTPLGVITSSAEILDAYLDRLPPEERAANLRDITDATRQMSRMMEEVLLIGRAEAGRLECRPTPFNLPNLIQRVVAEVSTAVNHRCPIEVEMPAGLPLARGDEGLLRHILTNLLSNAVKYSHESSPVTLRLRARDDFAFFSVRDHGIGIPAQDQPHLFDAFHRGRNVGITPGTGLGMTIVRHCIESHQGRISFHSREGFGSRFTVALPLFQPASCPNPAAGTPDSP